MSDFDERWQWIVNRAGGELGVVQEKHELEHVYNLMKACGCKTYLEVGSAEGTSLHILGSIPESVDYIDYCEPHTETLRREITGQNPKFTCYKGDSTKRSTFMDIHQMKEYDCVLIDGGHDYETVLSDGEFYAMRATKYVFWHDIQLPDVRKAVDEFITKHSYLGKYSFFINSPSYGYGILEIKK